MIVVFLHVNITVAHPTGFVYMYTHSAKSTMFVVFQYRIKHDRFWCDMTISISLRKECNDVVFCNNEKSLSL